MVVRYGGRNFDNKFPSKATMPEENHWSYETRISELEKALKFYADVSKYPVPLTGGMGDLWLDCGERARTALASTGEKNDDKPAEKITQENDPRPYTSDHF